MTNVNVAVSICKIKNKRLLTKYKTIKTVSFCHIKKERQKENVNYFLFQLVAKAKFI